MSDGRVQLQPAFLLHRKPYRDTSLLLEAFTESHGRLGLVARGVRSSRRGGQAALLQPFQPLLLSWSGRGDLHTLTTAEPHQNPFVLIGDSLISGFYLNELLMRLLPRHDPHPILYHSYVQTLLQLSLGMDDWLLRLFERDLLQELGYGLLLTHEGGSGEMVQADARYCYHSEYGPQRQTGSNEPCLSVHGETLLCLSQGGEADSRTRSEAKRLMRGVLAGYLGNRPLASRELFHQRYGSDSGRKPSN